MSNIKVAFLALLFITSILAQSAPAPPSAELQAMINQDPQLLVTLNNHFGCAEWDGNTCLKCSSRYYFNAKGICCEVKPQCKMLESANHAVKVTPSITEHVLSLLLIWDAKLGMVIINAFNAQLDTILMLMVNVYQFLISAELGMKPPEHA